MSKKSSRSKGNSDQQLSFNLTVRDLPGSTPGQPCAAGAVILQFSSPSAKAEKKATVESLLRFASSIPRRIE